MPNLSDIVDFAGLAGLAKARRVIALAEAAVKVVGELNRNLEEAKDVMSAEDMDELRPLMDQIVPRAIETGRKLDQKLEEAKDR